MPAVHSVELSIGTNGRLWKSRPPVHPSGLVSVFKNRKHRVEDEQRPLFTVCAFNKTGDVVAAADPIGQVWALFMRENKYHRLKLPGVGITKMEFSKVRVRELFVALEDSSVLCFDVPSKRVHATLRAHKLPVHSISFHPSGQTFATASEDQCIIWDNSDWTKRSCLSRGGGIVHTDFADCAGSGLLLLCAFKNGSILGWDMEYEQRLRLLPSSASHTPSAKQRISTFSVSPDGTLLVAVGEGGQANLWDLRTQMLVRILDMGQKVQFIDYVSWLPSGKSVISLGSDGEIVFADVIGKCRVLLELSARDRDFISCAVDPHCKFLVGGVSDGSLRLYDIGVARQSSNAARKKKSEKLGYITEDSNKVSEAKKKVTKVRPGALLLSETFTKDNEDMEDSDLTKLNDENDDDVSPFLQQQQRVLHRLHKKTNQQQENKEAPRQQQQKENRRLSSPETESDNLLDSIFPKQSGRQIDKSILSKNDQKTDGSSKWKSTKTNPKMGKLHLRERQMKSLKRQAMANVIIKEEENFLEPKANPPLHRLTRVSDTQSNINEESLLRLLSSHENRVAFDALRQRGIHPAFKSLSDRYPIKNRRLLARLQRILSALGHWSPVFAELPYLPVLSFPFVKTTSTSDDVVSFELLSCVLMHWCKGWYANMPGPPVVLLESFERCLISHDATLHRHFTDIGIAADEYCWPMLQSAFSEVLTRPQWLKLWDNLIANWREPSLFPLCALAYIRIFRTALLGCHTAEEVRQFLRRQNAIDVRRLWKMSQLLLRTSKEIPSAVEEDLGKCGGAGSSIEPILSRGQYPLFIGFPKAVVDFQAARRKQIEAEQSRVEGQQRKLNALAQITKEMEEERKKLQRTRELLDITEKRRIEKDSEINAKLTEEQNDLAHKMRLRRLEHLGAREKSSVEAVRNTRLRMEANAEELSTWLETQQINNKKDVDRLRDEEALQNLEFQSDQRIAELQEEAMQQQNLHDMRSQIQVQLDVLEKEDKATHEAWRAEDEERQLRRRIELEKQQQMLQVDQQIEVQRGLLAQLQAKRAKHSEKMAAIERERRLRHSAEDELKIAQMQVQQREKAQKVLLEEEQREQQKLIDDRNEALKKRNEERTERFKKTREAHEEKTKQWSERLKKLEADQKRRQWEEATRTMHREETQKIIADEESVSKQMVELEKEHAKHRLIEHEMMLRDQELQERLAFVRAQQKLEDEMVRRHGHQQESMVQKIRRETDEKLLMERRKHEEFMSKLMAEREKQLFEIQKNLQEKFSKGHQKKLSTDENNIGLSMDTSNSIGPMSSFDSSQYLNDSIALDSAGDQNYLGGLKSSTSLEKAADRIVQKHKKDDKESDASMFSEFNDDLSLGLTRNTLGMKRGELESPANSSVGLGGRNSLDNRYDYDSNLDASLASGGREVTESELDISVDSKSIESPITTGRPSSVSTLPSEKQDDKE